MTAILGFGIYTSARPVSDEDALTAAIVAARAVLPAHAEPVNRLAIASTNLPYTRRVQAGLVAAALGLPLGTFCLECTTSERAATEAMLALGSGLVVAADERGAAAVLLGPGHGDQVSPAPLAMIVAHSSAVAEWPGLDFIERGAVDVRDIRTPDYAQSAYLDVALAAVQGLPSDPAAAPAIAVVAAPNARLAQTVAAVRGVGARQVHLASSGAAGPLLGLATALDGLRPGERALLVAYGAGSAADALLVRKER